MVAVKEQADHDLEVKTHEAEVLAKKVEEQSHELVVQREGELVISMTNFKIYFKLGNIFTLRER